MRILIADDDFVNRKFLEKILSLYGEVTAVDNGMEAVDEVTRALDERQLFDLICLDIMMTKLDGYKTLEAIREADAIIIGPGSLYTNVLPNLLVKNVSRAIRDSKAMKFYISNIMTEPGQTDNYTLSDHLKAINEHVGTDIIDYCLADTGEVVPEYIRKYNKDGAGART